eukprot:s4125_g6.t1
MKSPSKCHSKNFVFCLLDRPNLQSEVPCMTMCCPPLLLGPDRSDRAYHRHIETPYQGTRPARQIAAQRCCWQPQNFTILASSVSSRETAFLSDPMAFKTRYTGIPHFIAFIVNLAICLNELRKRQLRTSDPLEPIALRGV